MIYLLVASLCTIGGWLIGSAMTVRSFADDLAELDLQREELHEEWLALADHKNGRVGVAGSRPVARHIARITPRTSVMQ